jgi:hypothetical protein
MVRSHSLLPFTVALPQRREISKSQKQNFPQAGEPPTLRLIQISVSTLLHPSTSSAYLHINRGIGNYIFRRLAELPTGSRPHIFASSGGNAGLAAVHSARALNLPCTVVVPTATAPLMVAKLSAAGAYDVIQYGDAWKDADTYLREHVMPYVRPSTPHYDVFGTITR